MISQRLTVRVVTINKVIPVVGIRVLTSTNNFNSEGTSRESRGRSTITIRCLQRANRHVGTTATRRPSRRHFHLIVRYVDRRRRDNVRLTYHVTRFPVPYLANNDLSTFTLRVRTNYAGDGQNGTAVTTSFDNRDHRPVKT